MSVRRQGGRINLTAIGCGSCSGSRRSASVVQHARVGFRHTKLDRDVPRKRQRRCVSRDRRGGVFVPMKISTSVVANWTVLRAAAEAER